MSKGIFWCGLILGLGMSMIIKAEETQASIEQKLLDDCDLTLEDSICLYDGETVILPPPTIDNLILFLTFDQVEALDQSGNKNHGIGTKERGPGYFSSQGYSAHFNGQSNIEVAQSDSLNSAFAGTFSVSFWAFINQFGTLSNEQGNIIAKGNQNETPFAVSLDVASRKLMVSTASEGSGTVTLTSNARILGQRWTHVTITRSKTLLVLYVNGNLDAVIEVKGVKASSKNNLYVGRMPWQDFIGGGGNVHFFFDEFKVWSKILEESWIEAESGVSLGAGTDPHSIQLGCLNGSINKALDSCTSEYHLCTTVEQYSFAFASAKSMGWLRAGQRVWSDRSTEDKSEDLGLALCCRNY